MRLLSSILSSTALVSAGNGPRTLDLRSEAIRMRDEARQKREILFEDPTNDPFPRKGYQNI